MTCRYSRDAGDYLLPDGEPCRTDDYGDPTRHCTARRTCNQHVGPGELTCARCVGRSRRDLCTIVDMAALMPTEALGAGVDSEAAVMAGPACDPEAWSWRKIAARQGRAWHVSLVEDDDEWHPYGVLTRWHWMIAEDYSHALPDKMTTTGAADYLDRNLGRIAQDDGQDFPLLARELRKCRQHLEVVIHNSTTPERGAPCPECAQAEHFVRLVREFGHWCWDPDCSRPVHYATDEGDEWVCPKDRGHRWTEKAYRSWIEERTGARSTGTGAASVTL